jgi:acyl carrier protein
MEIKEQVRAFIRDNFYVAGEDSLAGDASLLEEGIVDSTGVLEVVMFLENTFDIQVDDDEMLPENLDSIDGIVAFIDRKRTGQVAEAS